MSGADSPGDTHPARSVTCLSGNHTLQVAERVPASNLKVHTAGTYSQTHMWLDLTFLRRDD